MMKKIRKWLTDWLSSRVTRILMVLFLLLSIALVFIGLDNTLGFEIGLLAATVLCIELTRRWRKIRNFVILFVVAFFGSIFLSFLHEDVVYPLANFVGGYHITQSLPMSLYTDITSAVIILFGPVGVLVGFFGSVILAVTRLSAAINRKKVTHDT